MTQPKKSNASWLKRTLTRPFAKAEAWTLTPSPSQPSITSAPLSLRQLMQRTPRNIKSNADDTRILKIKKIIDSDTGQPAVISVIVSTHDSQGYLRRNPKQHRCFIMSMDEDKTKDINASKVKLSCDCEYFMYTVEYALRRRGNADIIFSNGQPAVVRNPTHKPFLCKHLFQLAEVVISKGL